MSDEDFEKVDNNLEIKGGNMQPSSDELQPGDKVAPGKVMGKNGKVEKSKGREIVEGVQSAAEVGAAVASAGASTGATTGAAAAEGSAAGSAAKASKASSLTKTKESNLIKGRLKGKTQGVIENVKDKAADKIDEKAAKNPIFNKVVDEAADKAKVLNSGVGAAKSLLSGDFKGVKDNAKNFVKSLAKEKLKKIKLILAGLALAAFAIIVIVEFFIATLSDAWQNFDNKSRRIADNVEKLTNLYRGFGYEDSKSAFYKEMNELDDFYDHKLDVSLLLSTVFYSESMGFNTDYNNHLDVIEGDPVNDVLNKDVDSLITYLVQWEKDIISEAGNTYDDENGLVYNAQKIYRLRRLSAAMCSKSDQTQEMTLDEFINLYSDRMGSTALKTLNTIKSETLSFILESYISEIKTLTDYYTFRWDKIDDDLTDFISKAKEHSVNIVDSICMLVRLISYGFFDLESVEYKLGEGIIIHYHEFTVDKDKYDDYVKNYYFEDTPDIKARLPKNADLRTARKEEMLDDIYRNKNLFKEIFLKYEEESSEEYAEACIGAIDNNLISALALPTDISNTVTFDSNSSYGIINGKRHNGVDLNVTTAGVLAGNPVYSIADGKVDSVGEDSEDDNSTEKGGSWIKIKHEDIVSNETEYTFYSVYRNLDTSSVNLKEGDSVSKEQQIGKVGTTDAGVSQLHFEFRNENDSPIDPTNLFIKCASSGELVGDTDEEKIWNYFLLSGYPKAGIAGIMGNMSHESGMISYRVQGDFSPNYTTSRSYTDSVDSGSVSEYNFVHKGPGGGGYGLAQWTFYTRKQKLYDRKKEENKSIGDLKMQLDFYDYELEADYGSVYNTVTTASSVKSACDSVLLDYESPENKYSKISERNATCQSIYDKYKDYVTPTVTNTSSTGGTDNSSSAGDGYPEGTYSLSNGITFKKYRQDRGSWANQGYSSGTITSSGCGPTSVAILASGLVSSSITPSRTAADMGGAGNGGTNYLKLQNEMNNLGMTASVKHNPTNEDITNALRSGNVMLVSVESSTIFTPNSHIMTVVDINSAGQVYVINPNSEGRKSSPTGWYNPSELTKGSQYIITTPAKRVSNNQ